MGRWQKGQSGNPAGRKPNVLSLGEQIRLRTRNGETLINFLHEVSQGAVKQRRKNPDTGKYELVIERPTISERLQAAELLLSYAVGKPVQAVVNVGETPAMRAMDSLVRLAELANGGVVIEGAAAPAALPEGT